jgi:3-hydroxybutyryl-CoA dehydrogenase
VNEALDALLQGVASRDEIEAAMRYGVNYPRGPAAWARDIDLDTVLAVFDALHDLTGDPFYRPSMALRFAAAGD